MKEQEDRHEGAGVCWRSLASEQQQLSCWVAMLVSCKQLQGPLDQHCSNYGTHWKLDWNYVSSLVRCGSDKSCFCSEQCFTAAAQ